MSSIHWIQLALEDHGYVAVGFGVLLESTGLPLPGESLMVAAAVYAAATHKLNIIIIVATAATGATCGDQIGYFIGRWIGFHFLARWGRNVGFSGERLELGRFLFSRYGAWVVLLGRFVALLRTFVALLAGANRMPWPRFLLWNALGSICWASLYGFGAYLLGKAAQQVSGPLGIGMAAISVLAIAAGFVCVKHNESRLLEEARKEIAAVPARQG